MSLNVRQCIVGATDPTVTQLIAATGKVEEQSNAEFIIISHEPITLAEVPIINANGVEISTGELGSGSDYEYKRVSATQTILVKRTYNNPISAQGNFLVTTVYGLNARVDTDSGTWYSQVANNVGNIPTEGSTYWKHTPYVDSTVETITDAGDWNNAATYSVNNMVVFDRKKWYSLSDNNIGNKPSAQSPYWATVSKNTNAPIISLTTGDLGLPIGQAVLGSSFIIG